MLMRMIPTPVHAATDYLIGVVLIAAPWIFGFSDESTAATWISVIAGVLVIGQSLVTNYEGGVLGHMIPMRMHLVNDAVLGIFLIVAPWLFGFADEGTNAWLPFVAIGAVELVAAATTDPLPDDRRLRRREAAGTA
jgi:SPW repeat